MKHPVATFDPGRVQKAHLIGIGGSGLRALARVLLNRGWRLSGSDLAFASDDPLRAAGIECFSGHSAGQLAGDTDCVIYSSAIPHTNPELCRARELGVPVVSYAEMIGLLMKGRHGLAIAGTHGKSTTTAMAAEILSAAGCDPTVIYGAVPCRECDRITPALTPCPLRAPCTHGHGRGELVLVEACEFQQNFLNLCPHDAVILNIEPDHFDCYETGDELEAAFARFAALLPADGRLIIPAADLAVRRAAASAACRIETFGWHQLADHSPAPNWSAANARNDCGHYGFDLLRCGEELGRIELSVYGRHNVLNALAAAALTAGCGASADAIIRGLSRFCGLRRRLEPLGAVGGISFWDDYAHHPSAISTTLQTLREAAPGARIWCLFQPHQALRTARLLDELAFSLQNAERVLIADIFRAREGPPKTGEVTAGDLAERTRALGQDVPGLHAPVDIQQFLQTRLTPGDVLVVMGAGDIGRIGYGLMDWFRKHRAAR